MGPARAEWADLRDTLADVAYRFCALLRTVDDPTAPALGTWNVGEVAVHVAHAWVGIPALADRDLDRARAGVPEVPGLVIGRPSGAMLSHPTELAAMTDGLVAHDPERDPGRIAERIEVCIKEFCEDFDPDPDPRPWMLEGFHGGPDLFAAHLLSETLVHGHDLARAIGGEWRMSDHEAALVFRGFLLPIMVQRTALMSRMRPGSTGPAMVIDLRLAGDHRLVLDNTATGMRVHEAVERRAVDARMWVRPSAMTLLAWSRRSINSAVRGGELAVWGRRPWMAKQLLAMGPKV